MDFRITEAIEVLERTPIVLDAWLRGVSHAWVHNNYGKSTFSPFDVVGHLIHGERTDWMVRVDIILTHGEGRPFEPFDRYAMYRDSQGKTIEELLAEFADLRRANLKRLQERKLTDEQLDQRGRHPELGTVTLRQLLATWVAHDLNHLHQIAKCMAFQYREEVGPWRAYLSILPPSQE